MWDLWIPHDPQRIAQDSINVLPLLDYYLDCGDQDEYYLQEHAMDFHAFLDSLTLIMNTIFIQDTIGLTLTTDMLSL
ncbi:MAG: hypothetical protein CM1200mP1_15100 [Candidatus Neomarinimicrobiota bacterium]|nr:MAG: hypothetical protein CM1200mP1_15100 [Candidatus Neomarinimicrobiota bacterium]